MSTPMMSILFPTSLLPSFRRRLCSVDLWSKELPMKRWNGQRKVKYTVSGPEH